jgi:hypothetical protein
MSALSERSQPADQLIDAVIVWEALFGGDVELSFRISMGMAFLPHWSRAGGDRKHSEAVFTPLYGEK